MPNAPVDPGSGPPIINSNANFDSRILSVPFLQAQQSSVGAQLTRGFMNTAVPTSGSAATPQGYYSLHFLYNPSTVQVSHSMDASTQMIPPYLRASDDTGVPLTSSGGTLSFSLLFDRTYELWDASQIGTPAGDLGVLLDIHVLYGLTGITTPLSTQQFTATDATNTTLDQSTGSSDLSSAVSQSPNAVTGTMQMLPVWCTFPLVTGGNYSYLPNISLGRYFGYVSSINVSETHFTQRMIPIRCAIDITMSLMTSAGY